MASQPQSNAFLQVPISTQDRSFRVPSPPRILVPPPIITPLSKELDFVQKVKELEADPNMGADFLKTVTYGNFEARDHILDWTYEHRRRAQEILPFLFLGPVGVVRDRAWLQDQGITMAMTVRDAFTINSNLLKPKIPPELGIPLINIDIKGSSQLNSIFFQAAQAINDHLSERYRLRQSQALQAGYPLESITGTSGKVLVMCETGNERSAAVVASYIMTMYSVEMVHAVQIVQSQRFCVAIDDTLKWNLQSYQDILKAKRDVADARNFAISGPITNGGIVSDSSGSMHLNAALRKLKKKRSLDHVYEEEVTMGNGSETFGEAKREGSAPFH